MVINKERIIIGFLMYIFAVYLCNSGSRNLLNVSFICIFICRNVEVWLSAVCRLRKTSMSLMTNFSVFSLTKLNVFFRTFCTFDEKMQKILSLVKESKGKVKSELLIRTFAHYSNLTI